jgi:hypothetical protein
MGTQRSVFTSQDGLSKGISVAVGPDLANKNAQRAATYNAAAHEWNQSAERPSINNLVNNMSPMGFAMEPPDIKRPQTFSGSTYHLGWNPGSLLGLAGMAAPIPGAGTVLGAAGQAAYSALGGKNPILTGPGSMGMPTWDAPTNQPNPGAVPNGGSTGTGGMTAFPQQQGMSAPGGAAFGPQPTKPTPQPDPMAGLFAPKLPNHSLPQNYQSMFPNSLSKDDLSLLYAKALA